MENQWYYARQGADRQGPVPESEIRLLIAQGQLHGTDLLWRDGLPAWVPLNTLAEFQATPSSPAAPFAEPAGLVPVPSGLRGWMTFGGILNILMGISYVLSCFGLPIGIVQIIAGAALISASSMLDRLPGVSPEIVPFLQKLRTFFLMTGVVVLLGIALAVLMLVTMFAIGAASVTPILEQLNSL